MSGSDSALFGHHPTSGSDRIRMAKCFVTSTGMHSRIEDPKSPRESYQMSFLGEDLMLELSLSITNNLMTYWLCHGSKTR